MGEVGAETDIGIDVEVVPIHPSMVLGVCCVRPMTFSLSSKAESGSGSENLAWLEPTYCLLYLYLVCTTIKSHHTHSLVCYCFLDGEECNEARQGSSRGINRSIINQIMNHTV
jgi:hypothetical protein